LQGEAIIRPSGKSPNHLTVTWKVADDIYQHIQVEERDKQRAFEIGKKLLINGEVDMAFNGGDIQSSTFIWISGV
jgi:transcription elongation factor SPT6